MLRRLAGAYRSVVDQRDTCVVCARPSAPPDDAKAYLLKVGNLASYKSQVREVNAWTEKYGKLRRTHVTAAQVRQARSDWLAEGYPEDRQQPRTDVPVAQVIPPGDVRGFDVRTGGQCHCK